jgi:hypothetical protein
MTVMKFYGYYEQLQNQLALTGIGGVWRDLDNQKQYVANTGAILNWWRSTKTVNFQGGPPAAKEELKAAFFAMNQKEVRLCKI